MNIKKIFLLFTASISLSVMAEEVPINLVIWAKDGTKVSYKLDDTPKISFTDESLVISANSVEVNYELAQMARITYEKINLTGIIDVNGEKVCPFKFTGESLMFPTFSADATVKIYETTGRLVLGHNVHKGETLAVSLNSLKNGIYLVSVNCVTYKITVK